MLRSEVQTMQVRKHHNSFVTRLDVGTLILSTLFITSIMHHYNYNVTNKLLIIPGAGCMINMFHITSEIRDHKKCHLINPTIHIYT